MIHIDSRKSPYCDVIYSVNPSGFLLCAYLDFQVTKLCEILLLQTSGCFFILLAPEMSSPVCVCVCVCVYSFSFQHLCTQSRVQKEMFFPFWCQKNAVPSSPLMGAHISLSLSFCCHLSEALEKMKGVYEHSPQMGDPSSLEPQISETAQSIGRLTGELAKYEVISHTHTHTPCANDARSVCASVDFFCRWCVADVAVGRSGRRRLFQRHQQ